MAQVLRVHGTCVARDGAGVLLLGPSGAGKSDLALRLLTRGFELVADDRVLIEDGAASAPASLAGLIEVRGLGILRVPYLELARLALTVELGETERLPRPCRHEVLDLPLMRVRAESASAPERVAYGLDCATGRMSQLAGSFGP